MDINGLGVIIEQKVKADEQRHRETLAKFDEMKAHCQATCDKCSERFKDVDKRLNDNENEIIKIKTIGSILAVIWGGIVTFAGHIISEIK